MKLYVYSLFTCAFLVVTHAQGKISVNVPSGSRNYDALDKLEAYGCAGTTFRAILPGTHAEHLSGLLSIDAERCAATESLLKERELMLRPLRQSDLTGSLFFYPNDSISLLGFEAVTDPIYPLREGRVRFPGPNLFGEISLNTETGKEAGVALSATPGFNFALDDYKHLNGRFYFHEVYLKAGYRRLELTWGRVQERFGNFKHGNLILSGAAKPLDLIKLSVRPHSLGFLGPFTLTTWLASIKESAFVQSSKIWALELGLRPFTFYEIAFLELNQFGGIGTPTIEAGDLLAMLAYSNSTRLQERRHRGFAIHQGIWGPDHYFKLYLQIFFDRLTRVSDWLSQEISTALGLWFPKVGLWDLRLEFINTVPNAYGNGIYRQGWSAERTPLGHPLGSDARALYLDFGVPAISDWLPEVGFAVEQRNLSRSVRGTEREDRVGGDIRVSKRWLQTELLLSTQFRRVENYQYVLGASENLFGALVELKYSLF